MWVFFDDKVETTRVPNGRKVLRTCEKCGEHATFYERKLERTFRLYFVDVFKHDAQIVMACGACGATFATDDPSVTAQTTQDGTVVGALGSAFAKGKGLVERSKVGDFVDEAVEKGRTALDEAKIGEALEAGAERAKKEGARLQDRFRAAVDGASKRGAKKEN